MSNMNDKESREFLKEWNSPTLEFEWIHNNNITLHKKEFNKDLLR